MVAWMKLDYTEHNAINKKKDSDSAKSTNGMKDTEFQTANMFTWL